MSKDKEVVEVSLKFKDSSTVKGALWSLLFIFIGLVCSLGWGGVVLGIGVVGLFMNIISPPDDWMEE